MILVGDIGATNSRLGFAESRDTTPRLVAYKKYPSGNYTSLVHILHELRREFTHPIDRACLGIAGPIRNQRCEATNLQWVVDGREVSEALGGITTLLINDLEAMAYGVSALQENEFEILNQGSAEAAGNACVVSIGTGLGEAGMYWDGRRHLPFASEGGHTSYAPVTDLQTALHQYLRRHFQHVSWERVLSGQGLINIYHFFRDTRGGDEPAWLREEIRSGDPAAAISRAALEGKSEICEQALDLLVAHCGHECGNAALKFMASGGIYLGGGIPPKILPMFKRTTFLGAFLAKGRMRPLLESIPIRVILNDKTGLLGAAVRAASMA
jgi:glucokinase